MAEQEAEHTKVEYCAITAKTFELARLQQLLQLKLGDAKEMKLICENQIGLHITSNPIFHERTKHIDRLSLCWFR